MFGHMHKVLNKICLQNFLHRWVVNHEMNLMSLINPGSLDSSRDLQLIRAKSFTNRFYLVLHACVQTFDVMFLSVLFWDVNKAWSTEQQQATSSGSQRGRSDQEKKQATSSGVKCSSFKLRSLLAHVVL